MEHKNGIHLTVDSIRVSKASTRSESLKAYYIRGVPNITIWEKAKHDSHTVEVFGSYVSPSDESHSHSSGSASIPLPPAY